MTLGLCDLASIDHYNKINSHEMITLECKSYIFTFFSYLLWHYITFIGIPTNTITHLEDM